MNSITERIVERANSLSLKQTDIMSATGAGKTTVHKWFNNINEPSAKYLESLASVLQVNVKWLVTGKGSINPDYALSNIEPVLDRKIKSAPVLNLVQAGVFTEIGDNVYDEYEDYLDDPCFSDNMYWLRLRGDSMNPAFWDGDLVLVDANKQPKAGDFVIGVVDSENKATFKKYKVCWDEKKQREYCQLIPLNEFYAIVDSRYKPIHIRGVAVKHERFLR